MTEFITKNYTLIVIVAAFLIFALIGYAVDSTKNKKNKESDLLTKPNDEVDVNMIKTEPNITEDVTSAPVMDEAPSDGTNMNMGN